MPIDQATTHSLEALKAYSAGMKTRGEQGDAEAIPFFKRAIEHDPNFASAYASLGSCYGNTGEDELGRQFTVKAYELRDRASEREKLRILTMHFFDTGEMESEVETTQIWAREYPRDKLAHLDLARAYDRSGRYESAATADLEALRLDPDYAPAYADLMREYFWLDHLGEAKAAYQQALARNINISGLHLIRYWIAFSESDQAEMDRQMAWAENKRDEGDFLVIASAGEEFYGRLVKARELRERAVKAYQRNGRGNEAHLYKAWWAFREALYGNVERARQIDTAKLVWGSAYPWMPVARARTLALIGDSTHAEALADDLARRYPVHKTIQGYWLPVIHAQIEMDHHHPARAIQLLQATVSLEFNGWGELYADYLRGQAYLGLRQGSEAAAEFQKLLEHRGLVSFDPWDALTHLQIARACAIQAQSATGPNAGALCAKARAAYQDFLTLWKDADRDIPILKQAKAEYAKLM